MNQMVKSRSPQRQSVTRRAYTVDETARITTFSPRQIYRLIAAGKLKSIKLAGRRLILAGSIEELVPDA
jgi:excisionase family DNA binding protein